MHNICDIMRNLPSGIVVNTGMNKLVYGYYKIIRMNFHMKKRNKANKFLFTMLKYASRR